MAFKGHGSRSAWLIVVLLTGLCCSTGVANRSIEQAGSTQRVRLERLKDKSAEVVIAIQGSALSSNEKAVLGLIVEGSNCKLLAVDNYYKGYKKYQDVGRMVSTILDDAEGMLGDVEYMMLSDAGKARLAHLMSDVGKAKEN